MQIDHAALGQRVAHARAGEPQRRAAVALVGDRGTVRERRKVAAKPRAVSRDEQPCPGPDQTSGAQPDRSARGVGGSARPKRSRTPAAERGLAVRERSGSRGRARRAARR